VNNCYVIGFDEIGKDDIKSAGGKGAKLGEIVKMGIPVPEGFVTTASCDRLIQKYILMKRSKKS
jgi:phosphoenolpyruvate synthase/pyruvate phosphate dikinase